MKIKQSFYKNINENVNKYKLQNGLEVIIIPKKGFKKTFVLIGTKYGSLTNTFIPYSKDDYINVPLGIAHFLEHKIFANEDGTDAMNLFSELGLDANAYTDYLQTAYLFSGTKNIKEGINILLDFIQKPYFTEENIESEREIITQELKMYLDTPGDRLHNGLMNNMFKEYDLKYDVGGTIDSIKMINKDNLMQCYETFYHPSNMKMIIVGDELVDDLLDEVIKNQEKKSFFPIKDIKKKYSVENEVVFKKYDQCQMDINNSLVSVGIKLPFRNYQKNEALVLEMLLKIVLTSTIGPSTKFYQELLDKKLILTYIKHSVYIDGISGYIKIVADTNTPRELIKVITDKLIKMKKINITSKTFNRFKKATLGSFIKTLNNLEAIGTTYLEYDFKDCDFFLLSELLEDKTVEDAKLLSKYFVKDAITAYVINPSKQN